MQYLKKMHIKLSPSRIILLGFIISILFGAFLLNLPFSSQDGNSIGFLDAVFTATSAVCVTGLVVVDTNTHWTIFGEIVIMALIQIGALGIMSVITIFSIFTHMRLGLRERMTIQESISNFTLGGIVRTFKIIMLLTGIIELCGAVLLSTQFIPIYGLGKGVLMSLFHSVSAFCNAGFDLFGTEAQKFSSLTQFNSNPLILLTLSALIIVGGLGFIVWNDIAANKHFSSYTLHTKLVLMTTALLLAFGTGAFLILEYNNASTLKDMPFFIKILNAFFHSVTTRTAGFNAIPVSEMADASNFISIILMFIGAAPGSTAGGIKVTTISVIFLTVVSFIKGRQDVQIMRNRIPGNIIFKAISIMAIGITIIFTGTLILLANNEGRFLEVLFEVASAFGTAGLSMGITPNLCTISKLTLILTMFLGRIGSFTAIVAFASMQNKRNITYKYVEGKITVG